MRKNSGGYQSAVVTKKTDAPRSYNVRTKDGAIYRRISRHLKKPRHYAGEVPRTSAPEALRYEIPHEAQLPVIKRPAIPTVLPPKSTRRSTCGGRSRGEQYPVAVDMDGYINRPSDTKSELCNLYLCKFNTRTLSL